MSAKEIRRDTQSNQAFLNSSNKVTRTYHSLNRLKKSITRWLHSSFFIPLATCVRG